MAGNFGRADFPKKPVGIACKPSRARGATIAAANCIDDEADQYLKAVLKVPLKAGNSNADIADIALQQLVETEA